MKPAGRGTRAVTWLLLAFAALYLGTIAILALGQTQFIYPAPRGNVLAPESFSQIAYATQDGLTLRAGYRPAERGRPTIVYFHGNGADWVSSVVATDRLVPRGYGVLAAEYRGYRDNPGSPSEAGLYADGRAALAFLEEEGVRAGDIVLIGNSIGSGVATQLASETRPRALVLISPFTSLLDIAREKLWWAPVSRLLRDRFDNRSKLAGVTAPVLILHGTADRLIPADHSRALVQVQPAARLELFEGSGHDLAWEDRAEHAILAFLEDIDADNRN